MNTVFSGPYLFGNQSDPSEQKTICILENPWQIQLRTYKNRVEQVKDRVNYAVEDLNTALIRLTSHTLMLKTVGWTDFGLSNARTSVQSQTATAPIFVPKFQNLGRIGSCIIPKKGVVLKK